LEKVPTFFLCESILLNTCVHLKPAGYKGAIFSGYSFVHNLCFSLMSQKKNEGEPVMISRDSVWWHGV
jgi:hypothetical protein